MTMSKRGKFWLTVALAVTFPVWVFPAILAVFAASVVMMIWCSVAELVDDLTSDDDDEADE